MSEKLFREGQERTKEPQGGARASPALVPRLSEARIPRPTRKAFACVGSRHCGLQNQEESFYPEVGSKSVFATLLSSQGCCKEIQAVVTQP